jgi:hypothetical protein
MKRKIKSKQSLKSNKISTNLLALERFLDELEKIKLEVKKPKDFAEKFAKDAILNDGD